MVKCVIIKKSEKVQIDVLIDNLTDCLIERSTSKVVTTKYAKRVYGIKKQEYKDWKLYDCRPYYHSCGFPVHEEARADACRRCIFLLS